MHKEILYTTAIDDSGRLIHINNAEKRTNYYCPLCKKEFILRKSGKTGRGSRRPHFSHNKLTPNCTPEGALHYSFKEMLIELLGRYKAEDKPFIFSWACRSCGYKNSGNLIEKIDSIKQEYVLGVCRPDIALIDKAGKVLAVIEIVVTHEPEECVMQYYKENKITLIRIDLTSEEDLNKIEEKAKKPDLVDLCLNPKCQNRDKHAINRRIVVLRDQCRSCFNLIEKCCIDSDCIFGRQRSRDFTNEEIELVKSRAIEAGISVEIGTNQAANEKYPILVCPNCQRMRQNRHRFRF